MSEKPREQTAIVLCELSLMAKMALLSEEFRQDV